MSVYQKHVFVCNNERPEGHPRGCCKAKDAEKIIETLKAEIKERKLPLKVRVNKSGCLDQCEAGPVMVVYPDAVWYAGVRAEDAKDIAESLVTGKPIERLRYPKNA